MDDVFNGGTEALRRVAGCVTDHRLLLGPGRTERVVRFRTPAPLTASGVLHGTELDARVTVRRTTTDRRPVLASYVYALLDRSGRELLAFHWHPLASRSLVTFPHAHGSAALRTTTPSGDPGILPLDKVHLPTGYLSLADIVRLLVVEFGVRPRIANWQERLDWSRSRLPAVALVMGASE